MSHPFQLHQLESGTAPAWPLTSPALWFIFQRQELLIRRLSSSVSFGTISSAAIASETVSSGQGNLTQPSVQLPSAIHPAQIEGLLDLAPQLGNQDVAQRSHFLGYLQQQACFALDCDGLSSTETSITEASTEISSSGVDSSYKFCELKRLYGALPEAQFALAGRAVQILNWDRNHRFCGHCATPLQQPSQEPTKRCPNCGLRHYPRLSPAVIVRVTRGDEILLARSPRFRPGMYSVLAGFVEPGESLEDTIAREVKEEVGVTVQNIRYFGSQPWPFPHSLMLAFTAEYADGELVPEPGEIEDVAWFTQATLPPIPGPLSIANRLIQDFAQGDVAEGNFAQG